MAIDNEKTEENEDVTLKEIIEALPPLVNVLQPIIQKNNEHNAPIIKRSQEFNFIIMLFLILAITSLTYSKIIDGSAATGLFGAIIGYVFGHIYSKRDK